VAQRELARQGTVLVHGDEAVRDAETELPATATALPKPLVDVLVESGLCKSKSDARRQIEQGGVYVDGVRIDDVGYVLERGATLQRGKRDKHVIVAK
jgi:tyrosyl-tRNA synthetase